MRIGEAELTVISLGAGVQSSVMALMAANGLIKPMPDYAVFADTGWEPRGVYEHLDWLETQLPFEVVRVRQSDIRADTLAGRNSTGQPFYTIPLFLRKKNGQRAITKRQCTREYKVAPITRALRDLLGLGYREAVPRGTWVELWMGISRDEIIRMKPNRERWIEHHYPLIDRAMTRADCEDWFEQHYPGRTLPRSACIGCPYHSNAEWARIKYTDPESWADAVLVDAALRIGGESSIVGAELYLHGSLIPLDEIDFSNPPEDGQPSLFGEECEGLCGV